MNQFFDNKIIPEEAAFELAYYNFYQALRILSSDAATQYEKAGDHSIALQLKNDIFAGIILFDFPGRLSLVQKSEILDLNAAMDDMPSEFLVGDDTASENWNMMHHPCWVPLRERAKKLLELLEPVTQNNVAFFDTAS
jgi:hypothetical protein